MKTMISLLFLVASSVSYANVSGAWTGWGEWTYEGSGVHCDSMKLNFIESDNKLTRTGGYFDCQIVGLDVSPAEWTKQGNNLVSDGEIVGTITDNTFHLTENYDEDVKVVSDIKIDGGHCDYSEIWYGKKGDVIYKIVGRLFRKQN